MKTTLFICLCLFGRVEAESRNLSSSTHNSSDPASNCTCPPQPFNEEYEVSKIVLHCLSHQEEEEMTGFLLRYGGLFYSYLYSLLDNGIDMIGLRELRSALEFEPLGPWNIYNGTEPTKEELAVAPTVEAYYNLKEPQSVERSLDSTLLYEKNINPAIIFIDKKLPSIKEIFRQNFRRICLEKPVDRQIVDKCLKEFLRIQKLLRIATFSMWINTSECFKPLSHGAKSDTSSHSTPDPPDSNHSSSLADVDLTLKTIEDLCISINEFEKIGFSDPTAHFLNHLLRHCLTMIGLSEIRLELEFEPLPAWKNYNRTIPSEEELADASTVEHYYRLKEPKSIHRSLNSSRLREKSTTLAVLYLDKRFPVFREIFSRKFREIGEKGVADRTTVEVILETFEKIQWKMKQIVVNKLIYQKECWEKDRFLIIPPVNTTTEEAEELEKISNSCFTKRNHEELLGNILRYDSISTMIKVCLLHEGSAIIGLTELRSELGFGPMHPWKAWNFSNPSEEEILAAPTVEAYYELKEPRSVNRSLDSHRMHERNTISAIAFFDKKFPAIRKMFRRRFEAIREKNPGEITRKIVDIALEEYEDIRRGIVKALDEARIKGACDK